MVVDECMDAHGKGVNLPLFNAAVYAMKRVEI